MNPSACRALLCAATLMLVGCAATAPRPIFPPHLAHFADHPYFTEGCAARQHGWSLSEPPARIYFPESGAGIRDPRCALLHRQLNLRLAQADRAFRASNRCVRRLQESDGIARHDVRECRFTQEGWEARQDAR